MNHPVPVDLFPDKSSPSPEADAIPLGVIQEVQGPVIDVLCTRIPPLHRSIYVMLDGERYTFEVHRHLDEQRVRAIALHRTTGLTRIFHRRGRRNSRKARYYWCSRQF